MGRPEIDQPRVISFDNGTEPTSTAALRGSGRSTGSDVAYPLAPDHPKRIGVYRFMDILGSTDRFLEPIKAAASRMDRYLGRIVVNPVTHATEEIHEPDYFRAIARVCHSTVPQLPAPHNDKSADDSFVMTRDRARFTERDLALPFMPGVKPTSESAIYRPVLAM